MYSDRERERAERYLRRRRNRDEATALTKVRATKADLRAWRRDPAFLDAERAAIAAPRSRPQVISLANVDGVIEQQQLERLREQVADMYPERDRLGVTDRFRNWWGSR